MIDLLLVAEAPPAALERYFYFEDVQEQDSLFRYVVRTVLGQEPAREKKRELLQDLRDQGVYLIDLQEESRDGSPLAEHVPGLVRRVRRLAPARIILIKATVFDAAFQALRAASLPVVDVRVPFPGSGQQLKFVQAMKRALRARVA